MKKINLNEKLTKNNIKASIEQQKLLKSVKVPDLFKTDHTRHEKNIKTSI